MPKKLRTIDLTSVPPRIKEIWDEADRKKISVEEIVENVRKVRSKLAQS